MAEMSYFASGFLFCSPFLYILHSMIGNFSCVPPSSSSSLFTSPPSSCFGQMLLGVNRLGLRKHSFKTRMGL